MLPTSEIIEIVSAPAILFGVLSGGVMVLAIIRKDYAFRAASLWKRATLAMVDDPRLVAQVVKVGWHRYGIGVVFRTGEPVSPSRAIAIFTRGLDLSEDDVETKIRQGYRVAYLKRPSDQQK